MATVFCRSRNGSWALFAASAWLAGTVCCGAAWDAAPNEATPVDRLKLLPGFQAELIYSVPPEQGSWVALTADTKGRLITSDQYGKLYRVTPPMVGSMEPARVETIPLRIGMAQGLLYAFDSLYVMVNGGDSGLYRVRDTNGDDQFDKIERLRSIPGGGEHGPHAVVLGPGGKSLYFCCGNHTDLVPVEQSLVPRNWQEDQLLPRMWDANGHAVGRLAPGGWICRTDPDAKTLELVSTGYRNTYDIAFNSEGELFTYDADMEWDIGAPWYRPTRVLHATSGSEFGWRSGTGKWPVWYPDSLPSVVDIGPGSPTGIVFGTGAKFPARFQQALFICDWSYGTLYAVHLSPAGATYRGEAERFLAGSPFPVTDLVVGPRDGALYVTIGGRKTQSGLYRISYAGPESTQPAVMSKDAGSELRAVRRQLESLHSGQGADVIAAAWPYLRHADRFIRFAARIAVEHQPVEQWQQRALDETDTSARLEALLALARNGAPQVRAALVERLAVLDWQHLTEPQQLALLRIYGVAFARLGKPTDDERQRVLAQLDAHYPAATVPLNRELSQLLVFLDAPEVVERTMRLQHDAPTQEEQMHYALVLRVQRDGWTPADREAYFRWFLKAGQYRGGASFRGFLKNIRRDATATLTEAEKKSLSSLLERPLTELEPTVDTRHRPLVRHWSINDLLPTVEAGLKGRNLDHGRIVFASAQCFKCHRFAGEGGATGPDLTGVAGRFNPRNLLESLLDPDKTISDQYELSQFLLTDGRTISGRVINLNGDSLMVQTDMLDPGSLTNIQRDTISEMKPSTTSPMPKGLLDTFQRDEILDLVAYLYSGTKELQAARQP